MPVHAKFASALRPPEVFAAQPRRMGLVIAILMLATACSGDPPPAVDQTPNLAPNAMFSVSSGLGDAPFSVSFDASESSDPDGEIASYEWDFGDSTTASGTTISHTFVTGGFFNIKLTVTDNRGESTSVIRFVTVRGPSPVPTGLAVTGSTCCNFADLVWDRVPGAVRFEISVTRVHFILHPLCTNKVVTQVGGSQTGTRVGDSKLCTGLHEVRIRTFGTFDFISDWSAPVEIYFQKP